MERVTVDHNGEHITLEVPEGTSDEAIKSYLTQQSTPKPAEVSAAPQVVNAVKNTLVTPTSGFPSSAGAGYTAGPAAELAEQVTRGGVRDLASIGKILYNHATPAMLGEKILHPVTALQDFGSAYVQGHPWANATLKEGVQGLTGGIKNIGGAAVRGALGPESMFAAPYQMAAYEQEKIRANPNAPEYANNPYAMTVRGEAPTQGNAGAINQRMAMIGQQYGGITPQEQQILQQDRQRQTQNLVAKQVLQQPGTSQNFIERMKALGQLYGNVNQPLQ